MAWKVEIVADSISPKGVRLTSFACTYPRFIHSELMTHRVFSRNSSSSRAIPLSKMIAQVEADPAVPLYWGKNRPGMSADEMLELEDILKAKETWMLAAHYAVLAARDLGNFNVHKQTVNRLLEPFTWMTTIITATDFDQFFKQRRAADAQPEIKYLADKMYALYDDAFVDLVRPGGWHLPYISPADRDAVDGASDPVDTLCQISVARCARVSYLNHDGKRDIQKDLNLFEKLLNGGHWSPLEHVATPVDDLYLPSNLRGWNQYRKFHPGENAQVVN